MSKKILQKNFKKFFQFIFKILYGKIIYSSKNLQNRNITITKVDNTKLKKINNESYNVFKVIDGRVYNDTVENVAIINKNQILDKISYQQQGGKLNQASDSIILKKGTPRIKKKLKSNILILCQGASGNDNYFHWLFDILPKIKICSEVYDINKIDYFYLSKLHKWQKDTLEIFNISNLKILDSSIYRHVQASELIAVEHPWYQKGFVQKEIAFLPEWIIFWLREKFLHLSKKFECSDRVFIYRSESTFNHCKLINNDEVIENLSKLGFKSYQVGKLDFFEQIYLFNNAKIIIGPHGAAFSNIVFSNPNLHLIEIIPEDHSSRKCERICNILKMNYTRIKTPQIIDNKNLLGDMKVSTIEIENALNKFI